jgi:hypothetical protein
MSHRRSPQLWERIAIFTCGVVFVFTLLIVGIFVREPSNFLYTICRIIIALAAAGIAAIIPGFLEINLNNIIRAGGAMAVFIVVYFYNPAGLVVGEQEPPDTSAFCVYVAFENNKRISLDSYRFPYSDIKKSNDYKSFSSMLRELPEMHVNLDKSTVYRISDEIPLNPRITATSNKNTGVIIIPEYLIQQEGGSHSAFTKIKNLIDDYSLPNCRIRHQPLN